MMDVERDTWYIFFNTRELETQTRKRRTEILARRVGEASRRGIANWVVPLTREEKRLGRTLYGPRRLFVRVTSMVAATEKRRGRGWSE